MPFLRLMLQAGARHRWRSWLALTLLTAVVVGLVLAGAATARRTATAFPRFEAVHGYDAFFYSAAPVPRVASLPEVASVTRLAGARRRPPDVRLPPHQRQRLLRRRGPPGAADPGGQAGERSPAGPVRPRPGPGLVQPRAARRAHRQRPAHPAGGLVPAGGGAEQRQPHPHRSARHPARGRLLGLRVRVPDDVEPAVLRRLRHEQLRPEVRRADRRVQRVHVPPAPRCRQPAPLRHPGARPGRPLRHRPRRTGQLHRHLHRPPGGRVVDPHRPGRPGRHPRLGPGAGPPGRSGGRRLPRPRRARRHPPPAVHPHHGPHAGGRPRRSGRGVLLAALLSFFVPVGEARLADPAPGFDFDALLLDRRRRGGGRRGARAGRLAGRSVPLGWSRGATTTRSCGRRGSSPS